jgi:hypothetical protein
VGCVVGALSVASSPLNGPDHQPHEPRPPPTWTYKMDPKRRACPPPLDGFYLRLLVLYICRRDIFDSNFVACMVWFRVQVDPLVITIVQDAASKKLVTDCLERYTTAASS